MKTNILLTALILTILIISCSKENVYKSFYKSGKQAECQRAIEEGYVPEGCEGSFDKDYEEYKKERKELEEQNKYK